MRAPDAGRRIALFVMLLQACDRSGEEGAGQNVAGGGLSPEQQATYEAMSETLVQLREREAFCDETTFLGGQLDPPRSTPLDGERCLEVLEAAALLAGAPEPGVSAAADARAFCAGWGERGMGRCLDQAQATLDAGITSDGPMPGCRYAEDAWLLPETLFGEPARTASVQRYAALCERDRWVALATHALSQPVPDCWQAESALDQLRAADRQHPSVEAAHSQYQHRCAAVGE